MVSGLFKNRSEKRSKGRGLNSFITTKRQRMMTARTLAHTNKQVAPATSVGEALSSAVRNELPEEMIHELIGGIYVTKVTTHGKFRDRVLTLSRDMYAIMITQKPIVPLSANRNLMSRYGGLIRSSDKLERGVLSSRAKKLSNPWITRDGITIFKTRKRIKQRFVRYIDVGDIDFIQYGLVGTQKLENTRSKNRLKGFESDVDTRSSEIVTIGFCGDKTLDLLISNQEERESLVKCLRILQNAYKDAIRFVNKEALLLRYIWYDIDQNNDGLISEKEFHKILERINFRVPNPYKAYRAMMKELCIKDRHCLEYNEVLRLLHELKNGTVLGQKRKKAARNDGLKSMANIIWNEVFGEEHDVITAEKFLVSFVKGRQRLKNATLAQVEETMKMLKGIVEETGSPLAGEERHGDEETMKILEGIVEETGSPPTGEERHGDGDDVDTSTEIIKISTINRAQFEAFLFHEMNSAYNPFSTTAWTQLPLDRPLSHYWISSSHNTYLTGDQVKSNSSVHMYLRALRRGCKCLELDCWDGERVKIKGASNQICLPVIFHGHTLTSKILFKDAIESVRFYIEENPMTYPIILSLEIHCSAPYQRAMVDSLTEILGDSLYIPSRMDLMGGKLPSPEALRGKVVIKGKRPPDPDVSEITEFFTPGMEVFEYSLRKRNEEDEDDDEEEDDEADTTSLLISSSLARQTVSGTTTGASKPAPAVEATKVIPELARLTLLHGTRFKAFSKSLSEMPSHMHSIGETRIERILRKGESNTQQWRKYNTSHITRIYPAGARIDSSNYNPLLAWALGCQMVALNIQTADPPTVLNDGLFRQHDGCGYLLKPSTVMNDLSSVDLESLSQRNSRRSKRKSRARNKKIKEEDVPEWEQFSSLLRPREGSNLGAEESAIFEDSISTISSSLRSGIEGSGLRPCSESSSDSIYASVGAKMEEFRSRTEKGVNTISLQIRVLSASCLPKPLGEKKGEHIDPYIVVTVHDVRKISALARRASPDFNVGDDGRGCRLDYSVSSQQTSVVCDNGFCPVWNEDTFMDFTVFTPSVAMVHFAVMESDFGYNDHIADAAIPISCLRRGFRSIQLYDSNNTRTGPFAFACLLVEIRRLKA